MQRNCSLRLSNLSFQSRQIFEIFDRRFGDWTDAFQRHSSLTSARQWIFRHNRVHFAIAHFDFAAHHARLWLDVRWQQFSNKPQRVDWKPPIRKNHLRKAHGRVDARNCHFAGEKFGQLKKNRSYFFLFFYLGLVVSKYSKCRQIHDRHNWIRVREKLRIQLYDGQIPRLHFRASTPSRRVFLCCEAWLKSSIKKFCAWELSRIFVFVFNARIFNLISGIESWGIIIKLESFFIEQIMYLIEKSLKSNWNHLNLNKNMAQVVFFTDKTKT